MDFMEFKIKCDGFFDKNLAKWSERILFEAIESKDFMCDAINVIDKSMSNELSPENLNGMFSEIHNKSTYYLEKYRNENNFSKKFNFILRAMGYFGLENCLNEHSNYSQKFINEIKDHYGANYLEYIERIDKIYLSMDGKKYLKAIEGDCLQDEIAKKYIVMKEWQDITHYYYINDIEPIIFKLEEEYININKSFISYDENKAYKLRALIQLLQKDIVDINEISMLFIAGLRKELINIIGGKAYGLAVLNALNIDIPKTYVVPTANKYISDTILENLPQDKKYSVRSSADIEDGEKTSFAGMFDSFLDVSFDKIIENVKRVKDSVNNQRLQAYINKNNLSVQPNMAVVIQYFQEPDFSGVWIGNDNESGILEWVDGNGEKLVSGKVTPNSEIWIDDICDIANTIKINGYPVGKKLIEYQKKILDFNLTLADFEWCLLNNKLVMLQYRPVTLHINIKSDDIDKKNDKDIFYGVPASKGEITHTATFINVKYMSNKSNWNKGDILMAWFTDPEWMDIMCDSSGVITTMGGFLCHAAIIARELGIPCVTGIGPEAMNTIWKDKQIYLNGTTGEVRRTESGKGGENND